ncbi:L-2-hydroxyglutarate oxidase [Plantactinospora sp. KBS50]|uniref:L-2-hydroxyglutarate oxidase n=1 Tax=Plantactinospora sp. KBS50 TaxID=2024580 RepID=UPI000BAAB456|nr:L-2-hydroxyglutarate oxidase [Plantactinospora sp. KBS50]ASW55569.1 hydroxyglutarate oxidase [Plantactinospora sp. KBS50]
MRRYVVIGGGIVGLAVAHEILRTRTDAHVTVLEKEDRLAAHQTGHNSGVLHAGVYYQPGSLKARLCRSGAAAMVSFCRSHGIPVEITGKLIVAASQDELPRLAALHERAQANGLTVRLLEPAQAREIEPEVSCRQAMHVQSTGIVDYGEVSRVLGRLVREAGGEIRLGTRVTGVRGGAVTTVETTGDALPADVLVNCAGLHADRIARLAGVRTGVRIVPFRGEYYELRPDRRHLVRGLIYPVPDPRFPFLGVHLTKMIDKSVHLGPNAVLALAREGYRWGRINPRDVAESASFPGLWHLARRHLGYAWSEVARSLSRARFAAAVARLVPAVTPADLVRAGAGVRAQAITRDGRLVDDFLIERLPGQVHVLNAPSPAATSSLEIARHIVAEL